MLLFFLYIYLVLHVHLNYSLQPACACVCVCVQSVKDFTMSQIPLLYPPRPNLLNLILSIPCSQCSFLLKGKDILSGVFFLIIIVLQITCVHCVVHLCIRSGVHVHVHCQWIVIRLLTHEISTFCWLHFFEH